MKFVTHQTTLHLSSKIKCCVDRLRPPPNNGHRVTTAACPSCVALHIRWNEGAANWGGLFLPAREREKLLDAFYSEDSQFAVFVADLPGLDVGRRGICGLSFFHAFKNRDDDALCRRVASKRDCLAARNQSFLTALSKRFVGKGNVLLRVGVGISHIDFRNNVSRRLGLRMKLFDHYRAKAKTNKYSQSNFEVTFHGRFSQTAI